MDKERYSDGKREWSDAMDRHIFLAKWDARPTRSTV